MLFAIGRKPLTESLDLATTGIATNARGHIEVGDDSKTECEGVYAVGDVIGKVTLTLTLSLSLSLSLTLSLTLALTLTLTLPGGWCTPPPSRQ